MQKKGETEATFIIQGTLNNSKPQCFFVVKPVLNEIKQNRFVIVNDKLGFFQKLVL